jgi:ABC-type sugar transport system permease subunit
MSVQSIPRVAVRKRRHGEVPEAVFGYAMALPALLLTIALLAYPLGYSFWASLHDIHLGRNEWTWVGLGNYRSLINGDLFWPIVQRTLVFALSITVLTTVMGLGFALVLADNFTGRNLVRGLLILPWSLSQAMIALTVGWIFNSTFGPLNGLLYEFGVIDEYVRWFAEGKNALAIIALALVWHLTPFATLLFLGALQTVPEELLKAARVDGAGPVRRFALVTVPWIRTTFLIVVVLASLNAFLSFAPIMVLTGGGPGYDTYLLSWWGYKQGFRDLELGESAAIFYVLTAIVLAIAVITVRALGRERTA